MTPLSQARRVYCIGLRGVGMTALAQLLRAQGKEVWGSDSGEQFFTNDVLRRAGIECADGFNAKHLERSIDVVVRSTAYGLDQVEVKAALAKGLPVLTYPEALGELTRDKKSIAVTGSHGKTTTAAMLAYVLKLANQSPSAVVGSMVPQFEGNALAGSGELFVFEADEYQNKLLYFSPQAVVLTSIDWDHPDFFPSRQDYQRAFVDFLQRLPADGFVVACYDDPNVREAVSQADLKPEQIVSYGLQQGNWQLVRMWLDEGRWHFSARQGEEFQGDFWLRLIGSHNVANALAVVACARRLGIDLEVVKQGLAAFEGTARRLELKGRLTNGVTVVDDYAHHPTEIKASLKALRAFYPYKHLRCVFQPHTFSRTEALLADFATAFHEADEVVVLETYASAREQGGGASAEQLAQAIAAHHPKVSFQPTVETATDYLSANVTRSDLVVTMGAGDVWQVGEQLIKKFGTISGSEYERT